ncbi:MAG: replication-relaxation family protein [Chloroflexi bacterium]|nr:replication-relaxation family protein [Chloroflexota bacterium]
MLVPDFGTAPVARYREVFRRLAMLWGEARLGEDLDDARPELVVGTPDRDGTGARCGDWRALIDRILHRCVERPLQVRVVSWTWVAEQLGSARSAEVLDDDRPPCRGRENAAVGILRQPALERSREQLLPLVGRHPLLTVDQLARLLGIAVDRVRRLECELIEKGLLRRIDFGELPGGRMLPARDEFAAWAWWRSRPQRRRLAGWLGLRPAAASRYHGLTGGARRDGRRRWQLLRALAHTLGVNAVFVAFAVAAQAVRRAGGDDVLAEWRSAAASERRRCKPDGYRCYVHDGAAFGFFLE